MTMIKRIALLILSLYALVSCENNNGFRIIETFPDKGMISVTDSVETPYDHTVCYIAQIIPFDKGYLVFKMDGGYLISVLDSDLNLKGEFLRVGNGPDEFDYISSLDIAGEDNDSVYIHFNQMTTNGNIYEAALPLDGGKPRCTLLKSLNKPYREIHKLNDSGYLVNNNSNQYQLIKGNGETIVFEPFDDENKKECPDFMIPKYQSLMTIRDDFRLVYGDCDGVPFMATYDSDGKIENKCFFSDPKKKNSNESITLWYPAIVDNYLVTLMRRDLTEDGQNWISKSSIVILNKNLEAVSSYELPYQTYAIGYNKAVNGFFFFDEDIQKFYYFNLPE